MSSVIDSTRKASPNGPWQQPIPEGWQELAQAELNADIGNGDLTDALWEPKDSVSWFIEAQGEGIICGVGIAAEILRGSGATAESVVRDGTRVSNGTMILHGEGPTAFVLSRERTALNFLMHLSGVSTLTGKFVEAVKGSPSTICDTRKTLPGLRRLQKYAVRCGGGANHRFGLDGAAMIKDNHIVAGRSRGQTVAKLVSTLRGHLGPTQIIEVECSSLDLVEEAIQAGADVVMLDNMSPEQAGVAVRRAGGRAKIEISGGIDLGTIVAYAKAGADYISVGAITHSAPALPLHLEFR